MAASRCFGVTDTHKYIVWIHSDLVFSLGKGRVIQSFMQPADSRIPPIDRCNRLLFKA